MAEETKLTSETRPDGLMVVTFEGDLDSMGTHTIEDGFAKIVKDRNSRVLVDLSGVNFISSAGMAMLLVRGKMLRQGGGNMFLAGPNTRVTEVLAMAGFNELFDIYESQDAALESLEAG